MKFYSRLAIKFMPHNDWQSGRQTDIEVFPNTAKTCSGNPKRCKSTKN